MMVRIIIMITSTPLIATKIKNARGLDDGPEAPPPDCVGEAIALCCVGEAVALCCVGEAVVLCCVGEAVAPCCVAAPFDAGDAPVEVDIGELEEGTKLDWATLIVPVMLGVVDRASRVGVGRSDLIG